MAQIINGREVSKNTREEIKRETEELAQKYGRRPGLAVIIVGEDPASKVYVANKEKGCAEVGFYSELYRLPEETSMDELLSLIEKLNNFACIYRVERINVLIWIYSQDNLFLVKMLWKWQLTKNTVNFVVII